jgi:IS5 family transposase
MKKVTAIAGAAGSKLRNSMRSLQRRVAEIARASRARDEKGKGRIEPLYRKLLEIAGRVVRRAKRFSSEIASGVKRSSDVRKQARTEGARDRCDGGDRKKVVHQAKARVFGGDTHIERRILSVFETATEVIRKGKRASRPSSARW